ncbi:ATP-binding protein [Corynebacterium sp. CCM 9203]|uniref:ATP-binding protein n=1 Tax=Corynebacterium sp. CCM 9203 TaxID=3057615 RepID=UPI0035267A42
MRPLSSGGTRWTPRSTAPSASHSEGDSPELPEELFVSAPARRGSWIPEEFLASLARHWDAEVSVLRITALVTGVSLLLHLLASYTSRSTMGSGGIGGDPVVAAAYVILVGCAFLQLVACFSARAFIYRLAMAVGGGAYLLMLTVDVTLFFSQGYSRLEPVHLGDYCGIPAIMVAAALGLPWGLMLALVMTAVAAIANNQVSTPVLQVLSVGHGWIVPLPFFVACTMGISAARRLDARISRAHREILSELRSRELRVTEAQFLAHVHDTVLTLLRAVASGGLPPDKDLILSHLAPAEVPATDNGISVADAVRMVREVVMEAAPGSKIIVTESSYPSGGGLPGRAVTAICGAVGEAALNSIRHAQTDDRRCIISFDTIKGELSGFRVEFIDDGIGFDPASVPENRAGVRVSIIRRVADTPGCTVDVHSRRGSGTRVTLSWRHAQGCVPVDAVDQKETALPPLYRLTGMYITHSLWFALVAITVLTGISLVDERCTHGIPWAIGIAALIASVFAVTSGSTEKLGEQATVIVALSVIIMVVAGAFTGTTSTYAWPAGWWVYATQVSLPLLAIRCRAVVAVATTFVCAGLVRLLALAGTEVQGADTGILIFTATTVTGALVPLLVRRATAGFPVVVEATRIRSAGLSLHTTRSSYLGESCGWVRDLVRIVLEDSRPEADRRRDANLLELRLRDAIRSPLLDRSQVNRAVWEARLRGVRVMLLDERSGASPVQGVSGDSLDAEPAALVGVRLAAAEIIDAAVDGQVTVRLLPEGRKNLATIVSEIRGEVDYVTFDHDGQSTTRHIQADD